MSDKNKTITLDDLGDEFEVVEQPTSSIPKQESKPNKIIEFVGENVDALTDYIPTYAIPKEMGGVVSGEQTDSPATRASILGAQQGLTLDFGDEIKGGIEAGLDVGQKVLNKMGLAEKSPSQIDAELAAQGFQGDLTPKSSDIYKQSRDVARKEYDTAFAENPKSYLVGSLLGGLISPANVATAKIASKVGVPAFKTIKDAVSTGDKLKAAGKLGGLAALSTVPEAAVQGIGASEGETAGDIAKDAALSTALTSTGVGLLTGVGGLTVDAGGEALKTIKKGVSDWVSDSPSLKTMRDVYNQAKQGIDYSTVSGQESHAMRLSDDKRKAFNLLNDQREIIGNKIQDIYTEATKKGIRVGITPQLDNLFSIIDELKAAGGKPALIANELEKFKESLPKRSLTEVRNWISGTLDTLANDESIRGLGASGVLKEIGAELKINLKNVLETSGYNIKELDKQFTDVSNILEKTISGNKIVEDSISELGPKWKNKAEDAIGKIIHKWYKEGGSGIEGKRNIQELAKNLAEYNKLHPDAPVPMDDILNTIKKATTELGALEAVAGIRQAVSPGGLLQIAQGSKNLGAGLANIAGKTMSDVKPNLIGSTGRSIGRGVKAIYNLPVESIDKLAEKLLTREGASARLGKSIKDAVASGDQFKIKAALFSLNSTPAGREFLKELQQTEPEVFGEPEEDNK